MLSSASVASGWRNSSHDCSLVFRKFPVQRRSRADRIGASTREGVVIVGGGIAGCAAARALSLVGIPSIVLERGSGLRTEGASIGLWANAWKALDELGVADELRHRHPICDRVEIRQKGGTILKSFSFHECSAPKKEFRGVYRGLLLKALEESLPPNCVHYGVKVEGVSPNEEYPILHTSQGDMECSLVIGCDGAVSPISRDLGLSSPNYAGYGAIRGVAEFPSGLPFSPSTIFTYLGEGVRWGMYSIGSKELYWFVAFNCPKGVQKGDKSAIKAKALKLSSGFDPVVEQCVTATSQDKMSQSSLQDRWMFPGPVGVGHVTLCGDAMHPMTPNLGQGGCVALEDAVVLAQTLKNTGIADEYHSQLPELLREYESKRMKRAMPIVLRANIQGALVQIDAQPVVSLRNFVVQNFFPVSGFLEPANFDCGDL